MTAKPGDKPGDATSPPSGYRVRSAGSEVLLHNGDPLYGPGAPPSFPDDAADERGDRPTEAYSARIARMPPMPLRHRLVRMPRTQQQLLLERARDQLERERETVRREAAAQGERRAA